MKQIGDILIEKGPTEIHVQELTFLDEKEFKDLRQKKNLAACSAVYIWQGGILNIKRSAHKTKLTLSQA